MKKLFAALLLLAILAPCARAARRGNGSNFMSFGSAASLDNLTKFTYCVWIRFPDWNATYSIFIKEQGSPYTNQKTFIYADAGGVQGWHTGLRNGGGLGSSNSYAAVGTLSANVWSHICGTYDDAGDRKTHLYKDGVEVSYSSFTAATGSLNDDSAATLALFGGAVSGGYFSGDIHHLTLWSGVVLNQAEMMFHRAGGNPLPNSQVVNVRMIRANGDELDWSPAKNNGTSNQFGTVDVPPGWSLDFSR
jgi:hypothetical protein